MKIVLKFKQTKLKFEEQVEQNNYSEFSQNSSQRFDDGILSIKDLSFIKKKN